MFPPVQGEEKNVRQYPQRGTQIKETKELPPIVRRQVVTNSLLSRCQKEDTAQSGLKRRPIVQENEERKCQERKDSSDPVELARRIISMPNDYTMKDKQEVFMAVHVMSTGLDERGKTRGVRQPPNCFRLLAHGNVLRKLLVDLNRLIIVDEEKARIEAEIQEFRAMLGIKNSRKS